MNLAPAWRPRAIPLVPIAMAARGDAGLNLANKLLSLDDEGLARLQGASSTGVLLILGATADLPWVDGALYLGRDPAAPSLLLPTNLEPDLPVSLLERAFQKRQPDMLPPLAILPAPRLIISASSARSLSRSALEQWLEANR